MQIEIFRMTILAMDNLFLTSKRLKKNPPPWTEIHTQVVKRIKNQILSIKCLYLPNPQAFKIIETDASNIGYGVLAIVFCVSKFQCDLLNQKFLIRVDCKSAKEILKKDVKNLASKQIFARWQAILSIFDFDIEFLKVTSNSLPDYLTREFL
ncbi:Orf V, partial [Mucuna pruriens]